MKTQLRPMGLVLRFSSISARNGARNGTFGLQQISRKTQMNMRTFNSAASPARLRVALPVRSSCRLQPVGFTGEPASRRVGRLAFSTSTVRGTEAGKTGEPSTANDNVGGTAPPAGGKAAYPERLIIYHAGTTRTTFVACLKVTTLFVFGFFDMIMVPAYITAGEPLLKTAGVALCGLIPATYVAWSTSSFVAAMHLHLPPYARWSRAILERFARTAPPNTRLDVTTMSLIGKPRVSSMVLSDLRPANERLGTVNFVRENTERLDKARKWWRFRAVRAFNVQDGVEGVAREGWVWRGIKEGIVKRAAEKK